MVDLQEMREIRKAELLELLTGDLAPASLKSVTVQVQFRRPGLTGATIVVKLISNEGRGRAERLSAP